jgi:hypothetical protein
MDCGFKILEAQGPKSIKQDLSVNTFKLQMDCGFISLKSRDSLAKRTAEAVCFNLDPRIGSVRPRLESTLEGVRDDLSLWIEIGRSERIQVYNSRDPPDLNWTAGI